jgi:hypothetical protein
VDWTLVIAPAAAVIGVFLGQELQKRRELSLRAQQLREEMLLDLVEWTLKQQSWCRRPQFTGILTAVSKASTSRQTRRLRTAT